MSYLADLKWNQLPVATSPGRRTQQQPQQRDPLADPDTGFLTATTLTIEDAFVLYLKALSLLHCAMVEASRHWASLQGDIATSPSSPAVVVSTAFNTSVQWVRNKFNLCLDRAESLKQFANGHVILDDPSQVSIIQVLYEQALALSKAAAVRELKWIDPLDCDRAYQLAIWMLSAILVSGNTSSSSNSSSSSSPNASHQQQHHRRERDAGEDDADDDIDPEDRTLIEQFIASIVKRREALQRRLLAMQETGSS
ncbi:Serine/threonine-protein kinase [Linderina macrospora]|uniref:Serine/threonine-protein kinase n=1 Tax=Linderina macrospora TaxID=4868 RepID=A0ACC1J5B1_9FUNG|nr:Serine/threonine-protein kinase [Linderina macrospora]